MHAAAVNDVARVHDAALCATAPLRCIILGCNPRDGITQSGKCTGQPERGLVMVTKKCGYVPGNNVVPLKGGLCLDWSISQRVQNMSWGLLNPVATTPRPVTTTREVQPEWGLKSPCKSVGGSIPTKWEGPKHAQSIHDLYSQKGFLS